MKAKIQIEICANSYASALAAERGGADRIELCEQLEVGGITPSAGTLQMTVQELSIPVFVLIRPRGGDFCYNEKELAVMEKDIAFCKSAGAAGIVCGALTEDGQLDLPLLKHLIQLSRPLSFTFHRAFEELRDPFTALEQLIDLGVDRILTSGQQATALAGVSLLEELILRARGRITILPGSGINARNVLPILQQTGAREVHLSAKKVLANGQWQSDEAEVKRVVELVGGKTRS